MFQFEALGVTVDPLGILLAVVAGMVWGMLWYGPLFGKKWQALVGKKDAELKMSPKDLGFAIVLAGLTATGLNSVLQFAADVSQLEPILNIFISAGMIAFTFILPSLANEVVWEGRDPKLIGLNWAYQFSTLVVMGAVLAFFVL